MKRLIMITPVFVEVFESRVREIHLQNSVQDVIINESKESEVESSVYLLSINGKPIINQNNGKIIKH